MLCVLLNNNCINVKKKEENSPSRAPGNRDCMRTTQRGELSSCVHHRPMSHQRNPRRREDSQTLTLCYFDSCSISDKSAEYPPFCWCGCCYYSPEKIERLNFMTIIKVINHLEISDCRQETSGIKLREMFYLTVLEINCSQLNFCKSRRDFEENA